MANVQLETAEKKLLEDCKEVGIGEENINILRDIFGWTDRQDPFGARYRLILSEVVATRSFLQGDAEGLKTLERINDLQHMTKSMSDLILALMGKDLAALVQKNPICLFEEILRLPPFSVAWLVVQFRLQEQYVKVKSAIDTLCYFSPEKLAFKVVMPVIGELMKRALKK